MLLAIDISNSTIKAGIFDNERLITSWHFATERHKVADDYAMLLLNLFNADNIKLDQVTGVSISCVVPILRPVFKELVKKYLKMDAFIVSHEAKIGIRLAHDYPPEVGGDRIANALAIHAMYEGPAIAVAFGTATVFDCISKDGVYLGGAIAPGIIGALDSLTQRASQLFKVELVRPPGAIGRNSIHTIQSGMIFGFAGLVEGLLNRLKQEMIDSGSDTNVKVIATGGLAEIIAPETKSIDFIDQKLTLTGLRLLYNLNKKT